MTDRNIDKELSHSFYYDMDEGNDTETICYSSLISILTEIIDRLEPLENKWNKHEEKQKRLSKVAKIVSENMGEIAAEMEEVRQDVKSTLENLNEN